MSEQPVVVKVSDHSEAAWAIGIILLIVLCLGEPDLLDALIQRIGGGCQ